MSRWLTACMIDDCLHDPILGAKVLLNYEIPPHMELRIWGMWTSKFFIDSSGYGTAKSLSIALCSALRAMLMEERTEGILSATFAQSQEVYQYFDKWLATSAIFRNEVEKDASGQPRSLHGSNAWQMPFRNGSRIRTIPPDFRRGAERAGSEDWNDGYFDEWTKYPNFNAFLRQFMTRIRKPVSKNYNHKDPVFDRHIYMGATAKYQWHASYNKVKSYQEKVKNGSLKHEVQSWNYTHVPERYRHLLEMDVIKDLEESLPRDLVQQEIMGIWVKDSQGYYSYADVESAREHPCPILLERV